MIDKQYSKDELRDVGEKLRSLKQKTYCNKCQNDGLMLATNLRENKNYGFKCDCEIGRTMVSKGMAQWNPEYYTDYCIVTIHSKIVEEPKQDDRHITKPYKED